MQFNTPMTAIGLGVGAVAAYLILRKPLADRAFYSEYEEAPDFSDFEPSEWSFSEDEFLDEDEGYGWWWATKKGKARRRDRKLRRASRRASSYDKCVEKKGEDHKKCQRIKKRLDKGVARAAALEAKLVAKGKGHTAYTASGASAVTASAPQMASMEAASFTPSSDEDYYEQGQMELVGGVNDIPYETESAGISPALLIIGGVAVVGIGGAVIFTMTKKPKRKKSKKRRKKSKKTAAAPVGMKRLAAA